MNKIFESDTKDLCRQLGINIDSSYIYVHASELPNLKYQNIKQLIVHYDIYAQQSGMNGFYHLSDLIRQGGRVTVLTLCVSPDILIQRNKQRLEYLRLAMMSSNLIHRKQQLELRERWEEQRTNYNKTDYIHNLYNKWFWFIFDNDISDHYLFDSNGYGNLCFSPLDAEITWTFLGGYPRTSFFQNQNQNQNQNY